MLRYVSAFSLILVAFTAPVFTTPALAITAQEKMVTCKFGADDQKLAAAAKKAFIAKCMAKGDAPGTQRKKK